MTTTETHKTASFCRLKSSNMLMLFSVFIVLSVIFSRMYQTTGTMQVFNLPSFALPIEIGRSLFLNTTSTHRSQNNLHQGSFLSPLQTDVTKDSHNFLLDLQSLDCSRLTKTKLIHFLTYYNIREPPVPPNDDTCQPPPLPPVDSNLCKEDSNALTGTLRREPIKIVHAIKLGYDVDSLEIHLNELYDVIDYFVITESVCSHHEKTKKPLVWEAVRFQPRFSKFSDKVLHFVLDDADETLTPPEKGIFGTERLQEKLRWEKLKTWNEHVKFLSGDDLVGFGDADEIANRVNLHKLRHCEIKNSRVDIGSWFAFGDLKIAFASHFPVKGYRFTLGNPTFWTYRSALESVKTPTYQRGGSPCFILGGAHLTHYQFAPYLLTKTLTATEAGKGFQLICEIKKSLNLKTNSSQHEIQEASKNVLKKLDIRKLNSDRFTNVDKLLKSSPEYSKVIQIPWYLKCNPERYPGWFGGKLDPRLLNF